MHRIMYTFLAIVFLCISNNVYAFTIPHQINGLAQTLETFAENNPNIHTLTSDIIQKICTEYVREFDPNYIYYLESEIAPLLNERILNTQSTTINAYFFKLFQMTKVAIVRAQKNRTQGHNNNVVIQKSSNWALSQKELQIRQAAYFAKHIDVQAHERSFYREEKFVDKILEIFMKQADPHSSLLNHEDVERMQKQLLASEENAVQVRKDQTSSGTIMTLRFDSFYEKSRTRKALHEEVQNILTQATQENVQGLILDLRFNRGGFVNEAVLVAGLFIPTGIIATCYLADGEIENFRDTDPRDIWDKPVVVLVSVETASAAELLAQALKDWGVAVIAGDSHTFGKGTIQYQNATDNSDHKGALKFTIGRFATVSGHCPQVVGVDVDIYVPSGMKSARQESDLKNYVAHEQYESRYNDDLHDVDTNQKAALQKQYLPFIQKPQNLYASYIDMLREESKKRQQKNREYQKLLAQQEANNQLFELELQEAKNILINILQEKIKN